MTREYRDAVSRRGHSNVAITRGEIEAMRQDAHDGGDLARRALCDRALAGDASAWDECASELVSDWWVSRPPYVRVYE